MAGRGGLNLTHSEPIEPFLARYGDGGGPLRAAIASVSAGRVARLVRSARPADLRRVERAGVSARHEGIAAVARVAAPARCGRRALRAAASLERMGRAGGWRSRRRTAPIAVEADATVLALGGASWPRLGSDGEWAERLDAAGVAISPLRPSNCGFPGRLVGPVSRRFAGQPLKRLALSFGDHVVRGEADHHRERDSRAARSMRCRARCARPSPHMARHCCASHCVPT